MIERNVIARPAPAVLRDRRRAQKREEILKAGLKVFAEKGYRGATMDDIALELQATKGLLYYHFETKEQILNAILAETQLIAGIEAGLTIPQGVPLADALRQVVNRSLDLMEANGELVRFLHVQALLSGSEAELVYIQVLERLYDVQRAMDRGVQEHRRGPARSERPHVRPAAVRFHQELLSAEADSRPSHGPAPRVCRRRTANPARWNCYRRGEITLAAVRSGSSAIRLSGGTETDSDR